MSSDSHSVVTRIWSARALHCYAAAGTAILNHMVPPTAHLGSMRTCLYVHATRITYGSLVRVHNTCVVGLDERPTIARRKCRASERARAHSSVPPPPSVRSTCARARARARPVIRTARKEDPPEGNEGRGGRERREEKRRGRQ